MLCDYGCSKVANFTLKNGKNCCSKRPSGCEVLKKINSEKTKLSYTANKRPAATTVYNRLPQETKDKMNWAKGKTLTPNELVFTENSLYSNEMVKQRIVKDNLLEYKCIKCGINEWCGETIVLDLDHINGDNRDNRLTNLRYLCPNCHSQTDTYKGRNKNSGKPKVTDQELLTAYERCSNIRQALIEVGLAAKGGNYERLKRLIARVVKPVDTRDLKEI
jgi:Zn finger protein HypA/HybF involved in hydrogenase expression